ncbi:hypothetical protein L2E82_28638 [Cichorium intybus]|uniref:Uncharacterized protein n=1 Tax=Cichorium intybus TaxID=13427 RepID=A0ACB9CWH8_CICIN|nr:hypothetical protein L2E82_28638 [Cichorium intybus]
MKRRSAILVHGFSSAVVKPHRRHQARVSSSGSPEIRVRAITYYLFVDSCLQLFQPATDLCIPVDNRPLYSGFSLFLVFSCGFQDFQDDSREAMDEDSTAIKDKILTQHCNDFSSL